MVAARDTEIIAALKTKLAEAHRGWDRAIYENEIDQREHRAVEDERDALRAVLRWYEQKVAGCRKLTSEGEDARRELGRDGGKRAHAALNQPSPEKDTP